MIWHKRISAIAVAVAAIASVPSCGQLSADKLPQPGASFSDGYDIDLHFQSVLNLPERAKVVLDGVTVGVVSDIALTKDDVAVTARMARGVVVPADTRAVLQQPTVLGDIYVALERPATNSAAGQALEPGGSIPLAQTTSPPQLEDTIATLANFVSSGSIQRAQNTLIRINRVVPSSTEITTLTTRVSSTLSALSNNIDQVDQLLQGVAGTAATVNSHIPELQEWFSPKGQLGFEQFTKVSNYTATVLPAIGSITSNGYWLAPLLTSLAEMAGAMRDSKLAVEAEIPRYRRLFTDVFLPAGKYPAINITSIVGPDGRELSGNVQDVLRILGAMP